MSGLSVSDRELAAQGDKRKGRQAGSTCWEDDRYVSRRTAITGEVDFGADRNMVAGYMDLTQRAGWG